MSNNEQLKKDVELHKEISQELEKALIVRDEKNKELMSDLDKERDDKRSFYELIFNKSIQILALLAVMILIGYLARLGISDNVGENKTGIFTAIGGLVLFLRDFFGAKNN